MSGKYDDSLIKKYFDTLIFEIYDRKKIFEEVDTIYFGGGTPSSVDKKYIKNIMEVLNQKYDLKNLREVTIEMNPESIDKEKLNFYKELGFNRFSLGVQSFNDELLKILGRVSDSKRIFKALSSFEKDDNLSVDFIYGIRGYFIDIFPVKEFPIKHISSYLLTLEEGSQLYKSDLENEDVWDEYFYLIEKLKEFGFFRYEVSNFSKEGYRSLHNLSYWDVSSFYIGYGVSAASYDGKERIKNTDDIRLYMKGYAEFIQREFIDEGKRNLEYLMLGLRKSEGVLYDEKFLSLVDEGKVNYFIDEGYLKIENGRISCTDKGFLILNRILREI
ncbi:MAG: Oxygen-independent coproporphyrinogen III oxidase [candidate division TA06 bacterium 32_111]|uniref:Oxygen-independent coproporphyrinogen III oxidase n=1 Tax=candidate division TA06 bacterium 34_109 TaxID=1635277 RepID=A0A101I3F1_UNCT6|nr:MAG: Oxygen-independent coproporphyrinogen III oxidase [candidate division TA06 bacterium 32_111]KUK88232.1 MAG: Oxygen-independent coproporphyrinogen III oxidase [candidate division TA06 bacterium 34_109]